MAFENSDCFGFPTSPWAPSPLEPDMYFVKSHYPDRLTTRMMREGTPTGMNMTDCPQDLPVVATKSYTDDIVAYKNPLPRIWSKTPPSEDGTVSIRVGKQYNDDGTVQHYIEERSPHPSAAITHTIAINPANFEPVLMPIVRSVIEPKELVMNHNSDSSIVPGVGNYFERDKNITYVQIRDFSVFDEFWIDTPTFKFNSHGDTNGWVMYVKQRHFEGRVGKMTIRLVNGDHRHQEGVRIRPCASVLAKRLMSMDDVIAIFSNDFYLMQSAIVRQVPRALSEYTDDQLLAEVHARTMARLGDYRGKKVAPREIPDNVIDLELVRKQFDESKLRAVLDAA